MKNKGIINKKMLTVGLGVLVLLFVSLAFTAATRSDNDDPMAIYAPEFVMQHQQAIGLTDAQRNTMKNEISAVTTRFNEIQWQMQEAAEAFKNSLRENPVDEKRANERLDKVLTIEREVKHVQITLVIRIKNLLTAEQRAKLEAIKNGKK